MSSSSRIGRENASVNVVIPIYNQIEFLPECLESLTAQTLDEWKAIVVDDASTNADVQAVVRATRDERLRVVRHDRNRGLAASRNTGIRESATPWVVCLDADDKLAPDALETLLFEARRSPNADIIFGNLQAFGITNKVMPQTLQTPREFFTKRLMPGAGFLVRREFWRKTGGYCEDEILKIGQEDTDFWITAFEHQAKYCHVDKVTYFYRRHGGNMTSQVHADYHKVRKYIYRRHKAFIDSLGMQRRYMANSYWRSAMGRWLRGERRSAILFALWSLAVGREKMDLDRLAQLAGTAQS